MMYLYNPDGDKVAVAPTQRKMLLANGWTIEKQEAKKPTPAKTSTRKSTVAKKVEGESV